MRRHTPLCHIRHSGARLRRSLLKPLRALADADLHGECAPIFPEWLRPSTPNDLRRTCAAWLRQAGAAQDLITLVMGHADTRNARACLRPTADWPTSSAPWPRQSAKATAAPVQSADSTRTAPNPNAKPREMRGSEMPRDRIELPTRGFSTPRRVWPKPRNNTRRRSDDTPDAAPAQRDHMSRVVQAGTLRRPGH